MTVLVKGEPPPPEAVVVVEDELFLLSRRKCLCRLARALEISSADILHDLDKNSMGSFGVCGCCGIKGNEDADLS